MGVGFCWVYEWDQSVQRHWTAVNTEAEMNKHYIKYVATTKTQFYFIIFITAALTVPRDTF